MNEDLFRENMPLYYLSAKSFDFRNHEEEKKKHAFEPVISNYDAWDDFGSGLFGGLIEFILEVVFECICG
ncbi:MAG: hypothetical protein IJ174_08850 [Clostridia bacterium]|nr:hypothetical protein [Clostridia bacterium]